MTILVVGDIALDMNYVGRYRGLSREVEELPIFLYHKVTYNGGGGGNLLTNFLRLGVHAIPIGLIGDDPFGIFLRKALASENAPVHGMVVGRATKVFGKVYFPSGHHHSRMDSDVQETSEDEETALIHNITTLGESCQAILVADYAETSPHDKTYKGVVTRNVLDAVLSVGVPTFGTSRERIEIFEGFDYLFGNQYEFIDKEVRGKECTIITKGGKGASFTTPDGTESWTDVESKPIIGQIDPCGCGDTFAAIFTKAVAEGRTYIDAIKLAIAGARSTAKKLFGVGHPSYEEIHNEFKEIYGESCSFARPEWVSSSQ